MDHPHDNIGMGQNLWNYHIWVKRVKKTKMGMAFPGYPIKPWEAVETPLFLGFDELGRTHGLVFIHEPPFVFYHFTIQLFNWLVVWNMNFMTFHILGIILPFDFHIFQRGRYTTNQSTFWGIWKFLMGNLMDDPGILGRFCPGGTQSTVKPISGLFSGDSFWSSMETSIV